MPSTMAICSFAHLVSSYLISSSCSGIHHIPRRCHWTHRLFVKPAVNRNHLATPLSHIPPTHFSRPRVNLNSRNRTTTDRTMASLEVYAEGALVLDYGPHPSHWVFKASRKRIVETAFTTKRGRGAEGYETGSVSSLAGGDWEHVR